MHPRSRQSTLRIEIVSTAVAVDLLEGAGTGACPEGPTIDACHFQRHLIEGKQTQGRGGLFRLYVRESERELSDSVASLFVSVVPTYEESINN